MELINMLSKPLAQLSGILGIIVCSIYLWKRLGKSLPRTHWCNKLDKGLRKIHIPLSIIFAVVATLHAILSFTNLMQCFWGVICIISIVFICFTSFKAIRIKQQKHWHAVHCLLTLLIVLSLFLHIGEVRKMKEQVTESSKQKIITLKGEKNNDPVKKHQ